MGSFKLRMHQNPFLAPAGGAYDAPPNLLVGWGGGFWLDINLYTQVQKCVCQSIHGIQGGAAYFIIAGRPKYCL